MHAELAGQNHCVVPVLSRAANQDKSSSIISGHKNQ